MKYLILLSLISCSHLTQDKSITLVHYNIKELSSNKLMSQSNPQIQSVAEVLSTIKNIDILSLNEVQYDLKSVPSKDFQSIGQNLNIFSQRIERTFKHSVFSQANTGNDAKQTKSGEYLLNFAGKNERSFADQVNFGIFPGQYSTGALSNLKIIEVKVYEKVTWKQFNPSIDLSKFRLANGEKIPEDIELFDKSFIDVTLEGPEQTQFHLVLLHTVPAYHFGNKKTVNYQRNADQLRFLEWYLTGATDIQVNKLIEDGNTITPLSKEARYVAAGDWNTELKNTKNPGSAVLKSLFSKAKTWINESKMNFTNEGRGYGEGSFRLMLDYLITDKKTKIIHGEILHPNFQVEAKNCQGKIPKVQAGKKLVSFFENRVKCHALVSPEYFEYKQASDHYPLLLKFAL